MEDSQPEPENRTESSINNVNHGRSAIFGMFSLTFLNYIFLAFDFILSLYASTLVEIDNFGYLNLTNQYLTIGSTVIFFGMINTISKYIPMFDTQEEPEKASGFVYTLLFYSTGISFIVCLIFLIFSAPFSALIFGDAQFSQYIFYLGLQFVFLPNMLFKKMVIARYKFGGAVASEIIAKIVTFGCIIVLLPIQRDISAYYIGIIAGEGVKFFIYLILIVTNFKTPNYKINFKQILKYSFPLFITSLVNYMTNYVYNLIFFYYTQNMEMTGLLYFINTIINLFNALFNSADSVLIVYYGSILYGEDPEKTFEKQTFVISKFFQLLSIVSCILIALSSPMIIRTIITLYDYTEGYRDGTIMLSLYSFYMLSYMLFYYCPAIYHIESGSYFLLKAKSKAAVVFVLGYLIFIGLWGLIGIPIAKIIGQLYYIYLRYKPISKEFRIGMDKSSLKKFLITLLPLIFIYPPLYYFSAVSETYYMLNLLLFAILVPIDVILLSLLIILVYLGLFLLLTRMLKIFKESDAKIVEDLIGKRIAGYFRRLLVQKET